MQSAVIGEEFRRELDQRAVSKGASRIPGFAYGNIAGQGYCFGGKVLQYIVNGSELIMRLTPDAPQGALLGAIKHALDPSSSALEHEANMLQEIKLNWNEELSAWLLQKSSDGRLLGIDEKSFFDNENLAQCCVNWLCK